MRLPESHMRTHVPMPVLVLVQWSPKYGWKGTVTTGFALIALVAWQY